MDITCLWKVYHTSDNETDNHLFDVIEYMEFIISVMCMWIEIKHCILHVAVVPFMCSNVAVFKDDVFWYMPLFVGRMLLTIFDFVAKRWDVKHVVDRIVVWFAQRWRWNLEVRTVICASSFLRHRLHLPPFYFHILTLMSSIIVINVYFLYDITCMQCTWLYG